MCVCVLCTINHTPLMPFYADGNVLQFENGYLVETVVEGNEIGVVPYRIRVSEDGELFAVDAVNSNVVRITPPLSQCMIILVFSLSRTLIIFSFWNFTVLNLHVSP